MQIQNHAEGYLKGLTVFITFFNRNDAEKAIIEKNHQNIGNNLIELFLAV